ncbi:D-glycero-beta-D-manno-heptose 1-phosphate adenylyltransferase [Candidatus Sumerlaeota bacterium]|nr:D-glycero-beta-D-manno-heptose 1-phosphate adenylyltransferase [Candidatus Sumerlaeota bacterium]
MIRCEEKILDRHALAAKLDALRSQGGARKIVFTNGCFDLVHVGHLRYLEAARRLGDALVVAVNGDASLRKLKGEGRPILPATQRKRVLAGFACVNFVTGFDEETPHELLRLLKPEILAKGANYPIEGVVGREVVWGYGGEVKTVELTEGKSTTNIIGRIKELSGAKPA